MVLPSHCRSTRAARFETGDGFVRKLHCIRRWRRQKTRISRQITDPFSDGGIADGRTPASGPPRTAYEALHARRCPR